MQKKYKRTAAKKVISTSTAQQKWVYKGKEFY